MKCVTLVASSLTLFTLCSTHAAEVAVEKVQDNANEVYSVAKMKEGDIFFHDRDYTITGIPKEFLGLTQIKTSCDCPGGQDYRLTFEIDRPAFVYMAWDSRHKRPERRGQDPKGWFTDNFKDTGKTLFLDVPHEKTKYWIYKSNKPYPKGKVELSGIDQVEFDPMIMWTIFLGEAKPADEPAQK